MTDRTIENPAVEGNWASRELRTAKNDSLMSHGFYATKVLHRRQFVITHVDTEVLAPKPFKAHVVVGHELWTLNEMDRSDFQSWTIEAMDEYLRSSIIFAMTSKKLNRPDLIGANLFGSHHLHLSMIPMSLLRYGNVALRYDKLILDTSM